MDMERMIELAAEKSGYSRTRLREYLNETNHLGNPTEGPELIAVAVSALDAMGARVEKLERSTRRAVLAVEAAKKTVSDVLSARNFGSPEEVIRRVEYLARTMAMRDGVLLPAGGGPWLWTDPLQLKYWEVARHATVQLVGVDVDAAVREVENAGL